MSPPATIIAATPNTLDDLVNLYGGGAGRPGGLQILLEARLGASTRRRHPPPGELVEHRGDAKVGGVVLPTTVVDASDVQVRAVERQVLEDIWPVPVRVVLRRAERANFDDAEFLELAEESG